MAATLVGFAALAGLFLNRATLQQNRRTSEEQFANTQQQLRLARETNEQNQIASQTQYAHARQQLELAQQQFELARDVNAQNRQKDDAAADLMREGQITDRYVKAVGLLSDESVTTRMAGVYALDRIMRDSEKDHGTIVQLLAGFIRDNAKRDFSAGPTDEIDSAAADVLAAVAVLVNRPRRSEDFYINLSSTCLRGFDLSNGHFKCADFRDSDLGGALLIGTKLNRANFYRARMDGVVAHSVEFKHAHLQEATLRRGDLDGANLRDANLRDADLTLTHLSNATLNGAYLVGAQLADAVGGRMAVVSVEQILTATLTSTTTLPDHLAQDPAVLARIEQGDADFIAGGM
ncbi:pentapeptide repeat-containing protein [Actinacidiphila bryophytorum]|uniref:pentapeptide repeat-containing protein n=1 Tax=Actinacidiphila bryophytorum TaxID=1436133 RepID=UPI0021769D88|nr:pentapeptide repeat-containing protein [Actinacidiphila bryophytorum]UWE12151.1 pentapeptide repeat-containing protein [Actinacidiphila bryophytorum]